MKKILIAILICTTALLCGWGVYAWTQVGRYPEKIWLHRANSLEKWQDNAEKYPNAEVDLIFWNGKFHVAHDTADITALTIDEYFREMPNRKGHLWLDIKNLSNNNAIVALHELDSLCSEYNVDKSRFIIESDNESALSHFSHQGGYFTSYYAKAPRPSELSEEERKKVIYQLEQVVHRGNVSALSFPRHWYKDISSGLKSDIPLLTWDHHTGEWLFHASFWKHKMLNDEQLKVILVK